MSISPDNIQNLSSDIFEKALEFYQNGGKLFIIPYPPEQDLIAQTILSSLFVQILRQGKKGKLFLPDVDFYSSAELSSAEFLLIHNLPQFGEMLDWLAESNQKQIIIATGTKAQWEQISINVPFSYYLSFPESTTDWSNYFEDEIKNEFEIYGTLNPTEKMIFESILALDSLGIPIPIDLLATSLNIEVKEAIDMATEIEEKGLVNFIEDEMKADLLVCSNATQIAQRLIEKMSLTSRQLENAVASNINSVECENKDERYTILNLFQSALCDSHNFGERKNFSRQRLRSLIVTYSEKLQEIWSAGDEIEHLLWGKVLEQLQLFEQSAKVFVEGLNKNKKNPFLRQAQARMIGRWSLVEPSKRSRADELFKGLTNETAENPYFLQARGVFESARNEPRAARNYFNSALNVADGDENKAIILTALANLEIEQGNFETAEEQLSKISEASKSPFIPHILAKLNFYRGDYQKAFEQLKKVFSIRPSNVEGWNLLGEIASKRAHWKKAAAALKIALSINSENAPTLRALGDLEIDLGKFSGENNNVAQAQTHFQMARSYFAQILEVEPLNFHGQVSTNVLLREEAKLLQWQKEPEQAELFFETAIKNLSELYQKYPFNEFITHNLGETYLASGNYQEARNYFAESDALASLVGLAKAEIGLENAEQAIEHLNSAEEKLAESKQKQYERIRSFNSLAEVWIKLEDLRKAENLAQKSFEIDSENGFTLRLLAKISRLSGRVSEADSFETKARDLANDDLEDFLTEKE